MGGAHGLGTEWRACSPFCCRGRGRGRGRGREKSVDGVSVSLNMKASAALGYSRVPVKNWRVPRTTHIHRRDGGFMLFGSRRIELVTTMSESDDEEDSEMGQGFFQAIHELEHMVREPAQVLHNLSLRELQLLLLYFSQQGRDSWCALEVFEWLHKENRLDPHTMDLMISVMCAWLTNLIQAQHSLPAHVVDLLVDMDCVGLKPTFNLIEKVISLYWDAGNKDNAVLFVKDLLNRQISSTLHNNQHGGPTGYLAWKFMVDGDYMGAVKLVNDFRECGLKPEVYSYLIAMTAVVKELNEFSKALRKLKGFIKAGLVVDLDVESVMFIDKYQSDVVSEGVRLSRWLFEEESSLHPVVVHERLLAMYICAGRGLEAEQQLWEMKRIGKEPDSELHNIVLAICASQKESGAVGRLLMGMEISNSGCREKTLLWLLRGYVKGGHFEDASKAIMKMLNMGFCPEYLDRAAVLQGLRKNIQESGNMEAYLKLCKNLSEADLIGSCILYMHMDKYQLWVIKMP